MSKGLSESAQRSLADAEDDSKPLHAMLRLGPGGRVVIPAEMREALGLNKGDGLMATLEGNTLVLESLLDRIKELHAITAKYHPVGVSLVDEYLAEKRAEVAREDAETEAELKRYAARDAE